MPPPRALALAGVMAAMAGVCDALGHVAYVHLATRGSIAVASALVGLMTTAVIVILSVILLRERVGRGQAAGLALGAAGVLALSG